MFAQDSPTTEMDLDHDLSRLVEHGPDAVDVVVFQDIRRMGAPLALSERTRQRIYQLALQDLSRQLFQSRARATA